MADSTIKNEPVTTPGLPRGRTVGIVSILTFAVSVVGYLREAALASRYGVSATMDAYFGAMFVPNSIYLILVVGTLSPLFIPILLQHDVEKDPSKVSETFSIITNLTLVVLLAVVGAGLLFVRVWLPLLFPGYDPTTRAVTERLIFIIFPAVVFLGLAGVFTAALNGFHKFALASFAPALSSMAVIVGVLLARGEEAIYVVGFATALGFVMQFLILLPATTSLGIRYRPILNFRHPAIRQLLKVGAPLLLYLAVANLSSVVERNLASRLSSGAVSAVTYATRLFAMPGGFIAAPLAIVAYPAFARAAARNNFPELCEQVSRTFRFAVFLFLPITVLLMLNALPITRMLYERGHFRPEDSVLISRVLVLYAIGILPYGAGMILLRCFYALQDTITPLIAEIVSLAFYTITATWLSKRLGIEGLALTRGMTFFLVSGIMVFVLWNKRRLLTLDFSLLSFFLKTAVASTVMGIVSWASLHVLRASFDSAKSPERFVILLLVTAVSIATFLALALILKIREATRVLHTASDLILRRVSST